MYRLAKRLRAHHRNLTLGQSLVEFALILPVFLVFFAATLDLGRVFYANITLNNAAREGAFQASITPALYVENQPCNPATNRVVCRIQNETKGSMIAVAPTDIDMSCSVPACAASAGSTVKVEVRGKFRLITPLLSFIFGGQDLNLGSSAIAQIEYGPHPDLATLPPAPVAMFTANPWSGPVGTIVSFNSSASTGAPTGFQWDFDGNGVVDSTDPNPTHQYNTGGSFNVTLTVVNLSGVGTTSHTITITTPPTPTPPPGPTPTPAPTPTPTVAPTPACAYPPNVIGQKPSTAEAMLQNAGFNNVRDYGDLTTGTPKNKIQAQNPDHTSCIQLTTLITLHYRPN
jgi:Flp pilus assembly protein TadG